MLKTGLFPEERKRFQNYLELPKDERPTFAQMAKEFSVKVDLLKSFFPKKTTAGGQGRRVKPDNSNNT